MVVLTATLVDHPSKSVQGNVKIAVKGSPLKAIIAGGSGIEMSARSAVRIFSHHSLRSKEPRIRLTLTFVNVMTGGA